MYITVPVTVIYTETVHTLPLRILLLQTLYYVTHESKQTTFRGYTVCLPEKLPNNVTLVPDMLPINDHNGEW